MRQCYERASSGWLDSFDQPRLTRFAPTTSNQCLRCVRANLVFALAVHHRVRRPSSSALVRIVGEHEVRPYDAPTTSQQCPIIVINARSSYGRTSCSPSLPIIADHCGRTSCSPSPPIIALAADHRPHRPSLRQHRVGIVRIVDEHKVRPDNTTYYGFCLQRDGLHSIYSRMRWRSCSLRIICS